MKRPPLRMPLIALLLALLALLCLSPQVRAATYHVAAQAGPSGDGTARRPFRTIQAAADVVRPGDTVVVGDGTYNETVSITRSGRPGAGLPNGGYIVFRAEHPRRALVRATDTYGGAIDFKGEGKYGDAHALQLANGKRGTYNGTYPASAVGYVEVRGFDLQCSGQHSCALRVCWAHHVRIVDDALHGGGLAGLSAIYSDYVLAEGNDVYDNCRTSSYRGSGIDFWRVRPFGGATDDPAWPGARLQIRRNRCYGNGHQVGLKLNAPGEPGLNHTDGNGIILDFGALNRSALVENNLCFANGGRGICVTGWHHAVIRRNTCWHNAGDPDLDGKTEFGVYDVTWGDAPEEDTPSQDIAVTGNVFFARPGAGYTQMTQYSSGRHGPNTFRLSGNLLWSDDGHVGGAGSIAAFDAKRSEKDPRFRRASEDPAACDFRASPGAAGSVGATASPGPLGTSVRRVAQDPRSGYR